MSKRGKPSFPQADGEDVRTGICLAQCMLKIKANWSDSRTPFRWRLPLPYQKTQSPESMSTSAISPYNASSSVGGSSPASQNPIGQALKALETDISQGNTAGAQTALTSLEKALGNSPSGAPAANSPLGQALAQLQTSLASGNASSAQTALTALKTAMKHGHRHHSGSPGGGGAPASSSSSSSPSNGAPSTSVAVPAQEYSGSALETSA